jgi:hypothetical protein
MAAFYVRFAQRLFAEAADEQRFGARERELAERMGEGR